jgi:hypothetical protein
VSDPTSPPNGSEPVDDLSSDQASEVDSGPIDVTALLESTRKLFEPEELQRSLEQAGYSPDPPVATPHESADEAEKAHDVTEQDAPTRGQVEPDNDSLGQESGDESTVEVKEAAENCETGDSLADGDTVDESTEGDSDGEDPALKGVNVLSIVAMILAIALSPLAVIFGYIALGQTRRARQRGEALALWAIGLGWVVFAAWAVLIGSLVWIGYQQGITVDSLREFIELFSLP